jgi:hypothetical protein
MDICRQCFREKASDIGFFKVGFSFPYRMPGIWSVGLEYCLILYATIELGLDGEIHGGMNIDHR